MISFTPTVLCENPLRVVFNAVEDDTQLGLCEMLIKGNDAEIIRLECEQDNFIVAEGLIKSAFNYACIKNCYMGYCRTNNFIGLYERMNLQKSDNGYFNDIPTILQGNCCKKHDNI